MKNIILLAVLALVPLSFSGCDSNTDGSSIESRIAALESAINAHSWEDYFACFASGSDMHESFESSQFDVKFGSSEPYTTYQFGTITVDGTTASCTSTKSTSEAATYANVLTMVKEGESWYIEKWEEDTTVVWQVPARK